MGPEPFHSPASGGARPLLRSTAFEIALKAKELADANGWFLARQFETADNAQIHENTTARELLADFGDKIAAAQRAPIEQQLKDMGRILIRYSGTEPLLRIMLEGPDKHQIAGWAKEIADLTEKKIGGK